MIFINWIPISEKLPTEDGNYIVSLESRWVGVDYFTVRYKEWFDHSYRVVAWMSLPNPYTKDV